MQESQELLPLQPTGRGTDIKLSAEVKAQVD
jgi:hypothetical protein